MKLGLGMLFLWLGLLATPAHAQQARYDRMAAACQRVYADNTNAQIACGLTVAAAYQSGLRSTQYEISAQRPQMMQALYNEIKWALVVKESFPKVWISQHCPQGDCDAEAAFVGAVHKAVEELRRQNPR